MSCSLVGPLVVLCMAFVFVQFWRRQHHVLVPVLAVVVAVSVA